MLIEVERGPEIQVGRPLGVTIRLIGNDGKTKGYITVSPDFVPASDFETNDTFRVDVHKGGMFGDLDMRIKV